MIIKLYIVAVVNQGTARASLFEISVRVYLTCLRHVLRHVLRIKRSRIVHLK